MTQAGMRAVRYDAFERLPEIAVVDRPACPSGGAVIAVGATGLCRSDWHGWMGHDPDISLPHVPGHEFAGTVVEVGDQVQRWRTGARVTAPFVCACGLCATCRRGDHQVCEAQTQPGFTHWGSFAEYVAIDHADVNLIGLPDSMDFDTAAGLGCRFATAYRAVVHQGRVTGGDQVVVFGCGGVGLAAVMIAAAHGGRVIAVDTSAEALRMAEMMGAAAVVDAACTDVVDEVRGLSHGGVDVSIDALGGADTLTNALGCLRPRGRHVQVGLLGGVATVSSAVIGLAISRELEIVGSHGMAAHDYPAMLAEIAAGRLSPERLITRRIGLADAPAALAAMGANPTAGVTIIRV
jgi:D-arabinose 1-dehydrogenase-like Zn-dependent alcohol dehydrogenase